MDIDAFNRCFHGGAWFLRVRSISGDDLNVQFAARYTPAPDADPSCFPPRNFFEELAVLELQTRLFNHKVIDVQMLRATTSTQARCVVFANTSPPGRTFFNNARLLLSYRAT
ncbi:unnamed protein product [Symbiodinium sp. CCMP2592]|nr:unnamed protein product [Symbiodinium sp. CCMP2592]